MTKYFYSLPEALKSRLAKVERETSLSYVSNWMVPDPDLKEYRSSEELPLLGESPNGRKMTAGWYSLFHGEPNYEVKSIETPNGTRYAVDFTKTTGCIILTCPAYCKSAQQLRVGSIAALKNDPQSREFLKKFAKRFLEGCERDDLGDYIDLEGLTSEITLKR